MSTTRVSGSARTTTFAWGANTSIRPASARSAPQPIAPSIT